LFWLIVKYIIYKKSVIRSRWMLYLYKFYNSQMQKEEYEFLRSHFGTLKRGEHAKYLSYAFTEQGVAMLSTVREQ